MEYNQNGNMLALAGVIGLLLQKMGVVINDNEIVTIILGLVGLVGVVKQAIAHRKLGRALGAVK